MRRGARMSLLDGRAIIVTGAGRGMGRAYAMHAAAEGASVVVNDIDIEEAEKVAAEIQQQRQRAVANGCSVADPAAARGLIQHCVEHFGKLDGVVNNAGVHYTVDPWDDDE